VSEPVRVPSAADYAAQLGYASVEAALHSTAFWTENGDWGQNNGLEHKRWHSRRLHPPVTGGSTPAPDSEITAKGEQS
jgi:hypothetical protein